MFIIYKWAVFHSFVEKPESIHQKAEKPKCVPHHLSSIFFPAKNCHITWPILDTLQKIKFLAGERR